ncbi:hypothetical protein MPER_08921 [Moniliophthora perniciosa FA553]|nr:hypothetical protein MPER_08921 [Moniliophthora perniciosa FA553]
MAHMCRKKLRRGYEWENCDTEWCSGTPSTHCEISLATDSMEMTKVICELYALDPKISLGAMMALDPLVECKSCIGRYGQKNTRVFERWTSVVIRCNGHKLVAVSPTDEAAVVAKESQLDKRWREIREWYRCKECDYKYRLKSVRKHLKKAHQIEENVDDHLEYTPHGNLLESARNKEVWILPPGRGQLEPDWPPLPYPAGWDPDSDSD